MAGNLNVSATQLLTIGGNTDFEKTIGMIAEAQIQRNLVNNQFYEASFRNTIRAQQIQNVGGISTAIYRLAKRVAWGSDYDPDTGAKRQRTGSYLTTFQLDKHLNVKLMLEEYDMKRLTTASGSEAGQLVGQWIGSMTMNLIINKDLIMKQAIKTWCIASYKKGAEIPSVLVADFNKLSDKDDVIAFQSQILDLMTKKLKIVNDTTIGTNQSDYTIAMSYELYNKQLPAYTQFIDETGAKTLSTGTWYNNSVMGYGFFKDIQLNGTFDKTDPQRRMNEDISYDLKGVHGIIVHTQDWIAPDNFESIRQVIEPETGNLQWIGKYLFGLPESSRFMSTIIMDHEPTDAEIAEAKKQCCPQNTSQGPMGDLETYRVQLSILDPLSTSGNTPTAPVAVSSVITTTALGELADKNSDTILAGTAIKNKNLIIGECEVSDITDTSANIKAKPGSTKYSGSAAVSFTIKAAGVSLDAFNQVQQKLSIEESEKASLVNEKQKLASEVANLKGLTERLEKEKQELEQAKLAKVAKPAGK